MVLFLVRIGVSILGAALALYVASLVLDDFTLTAEGFVVAVLVFTAAQAILTPFIVNVARKYATALLGGIGIISTLVALWVASLFSGGIQITGVVTWILAALIVWVITALAGWILVGLFVRRRRGNAAPSAAPPGGVV